MLAITKPLLTLASGATALIVALISQHAFGFEPCTLCIEIRFWIALSMALAFVSFFMGLKQEDETSSSGVLHICSGALSWASVIVLFVATGWAMKLVLLEQGVIASAGCSPFTFYASYVPLHEWIPTVFASYGICGVPAMITPNLSYSALSLAYLMTYSIVAVVFALKRSRVITH